MSEQASAPPAPARSNSISETAKAGLEKALQHRPEREELVERNILPAGNIAPSLMAAQKDLQRSQLEDTLENKLKQRPDAATLVKEGILNQDEAPPS